MLAASWPIVTKEGSKPNQRRYPWGDTLDRNLANLWSGGAATKPVDQFADGATVAGAVQMIGNVWEWTADCWPADYAISGRDGSVFSGGDCERRGYRGGAYGDVPFFLRVSLRNRGFPDERRDDVGFRLVLNDW